MNSLPNQRSVKSFEKYLYVEYIETFSETFGVTDILAVMHRLSWHIWKQTPPPKKKIKGKKERKKGKRKRNFTLIRTF